MQTEPFEVICEDGVRLKGKLLLPEAPKAIVQFHCGTATKKEFYLPFLEYLAEHGYASALWDYRGTGESAPEDLSTCEFQFRDYGLLDMPAVKKYLDQRFSDLPVLIFGHSSGGQLLGLMPDHSNIAGMVGFAISTGYLPHMPLAYRLKTAYFFFLHTPVSILFTGYLKAKKFGIMEDLPRNVVREWRGWCMKKHYLFDPKFYGKSVPKGNYQDYPFPVHVFWAKDDPISNQRSIPSLWDNIKSKIGIDFTPLDPVELKLKGVGHFGFFKKQNGSVLWPMALEKLDHFLKNSPNFAEIKS